MGEGMLINSFNWQIVPDQIVSGYSEAESYGEQGGTVSGEGVWSLPAARAVYAQWAGAERDDPSR